MSVFSAVLAIFRWPHFFFPAVLASFGRLHFYYFRPFWAFSGGCIAPPPPCFGFFRPAAFLLFSAALAIFGRLHFTPLGRFGHFRRLHFYCSRLFWPFSGGYLFSIFGRFGRGCGCIFVVFGRGGHFQAVAFLSFVGFRCAFSCRNCLVLISGIYGGGLAGEGEW